MSRSGDCHGISALPSKADMCSALAHVRFGPKADIQGCLPSQRISNEHSDTGQNNPDFGKLAELRIDFDCPRMLLDDDVVANRKAKAGAFSGWFGSEERVENLIFHVRRNAGAVIANPDLHTIAKVFG